MKSAYLIGIKGVGMAALAKYLTEDGYRVEGSDNESVYVTDEMLDKNGIKVYAPFNEQNIISSNPDLVIVSAAYDELNVEVVMAKKLKLNVIYYSEALGLITADKQLIAVAGVHGKTTTTSLLALLLENAGFDPSFIIGAADVPVLGTNAKKGTGDFFVLESDEYKKSPNNLDSKFLDLNPKIAIISSVELDHPDVFKTEEEIYNAFYKFACKVPRDGKILINIDYVKCRKLVRSLVDRNFITYGFSDEASWRIIDVKEKDVTTFSVKHIDKIYGPYELSIPGKNNILNAVTAIIIAEILNIDEDDLKKTFKDFKGVQRRFQEIAKFGDTIIIDDYAHHPTAVRGVLDCAKEKYPNSKIWCIFQPHTFSRTEALLKDFSEAFGFADKVIITDIYASERESTGKVTAVDLVESIKDNNVDVVYMRDWKQIRKYVYAFALPPVVLLTVGAGDIYKIGQEIASDLEKRK